MIYPWTRPLAWGLLAATVAALAVSVGYGVAAGDLMDAFAFAPVLLAFAGVGAIVASHRPANPIGWLFLAEGLGFAIGMATDAYARYATQAGPAPPTSPRAGRRESSGCCSPWPCCCSRTAVCRPGGGGRWPGCSSRPRQSW